MTIQETLVDYRVDMPCDILQMSDVAWLRYYNIARDRIIEAIMEEREDYFYNYNISQTIVSQNEYSIPKRGDLAQDMITVLDWITKVKWIWIKVKPTDTEYKKLEPKRIENLVWDISEYANTATPFYSLMDNSIFLFPIPKEVLDFKIEWIVHYKKVTLTDTERLPDITSLCLFYGVKYLWLETQWRISEAQFFKQNFENEIKNICRNLSGRNEVVFINDVNLSHLN